jgi:hypothetical protein
MASHTIKVTPAQVAAAKLRLSIDQQLGRVSSPAVVRIAAAGSAQTRTSSPKPPSGSPA